MRLAQHFAEKAFRFGREQHLIGVAGLPEMLKPALGATVGVIVLNSGLVHRVGPFRLHVELTRRLNASGYPTLRIDLSTLGDSSGTEESLSRRQQVRADVADAMAVLREQAGCMRFVLVGLCSGAANAHIAACTEQAVAGVVFLDGYTYRTAGFMLRHYLPRVVQLATWMRFFKRRVSRTSASAAAPTPADFGQTYPARAEVAAELGEMLGRDLKLYFVYSGGVSDHFNHRRQFREYFGRLAIHPNVTLSFLEQADHTYVMAADRLILLQSIDDWMQHTFPVQPSAKR
jgi:pimeloyl-ACP methyl ester carboxylesterase